jgi:hypothetical protein
MPQSTRNSSSAIQTLRICPDGSRSTHPFHIRASATEDRSSRRLLDYLAEINRPALCVADDLNVVEPEHPFMVAVRAALPVEGSVGGRGAHPPGGGLLLEWGRGVLLAGCRAAVSGVVDLVVLVCGGVQGGLE